MIDAPRWIRTGLTNYRQWEKNLSASRLRWTWDSNPRPLTEKSKGLTTQALLNQLRKFIKIRYIYYNNYFIYTSYPSPSPLAPSFFSALNVPFNTPLSPPLFNVPTNFYNSPWGSPPSTLLSLACFSSPLPPFNYNLEIMYIYYISHLFIFNFIIIHLSCYT